MLMSEKGQTRKSGDAIATSALLLIADIRRAGWDVRPVPILLQKSFCEVGLKFSDP